MQDDIVGGEIYIGGGETESMHFIAQTIKNLTIKYPQIRFHMFSGNGEDVEERLDKGLIDFGVFVGLTDLKKYNYLKLKSFDTWGLLMRKNCPLAQNKTISPKDIAKIPILCSRQALIQNCQRRKENNEKRRKENDRNAGIITAGLLIVS